jgi:hypothetical protein
MDISDASLPRCDVLPFLRVVEVFAANRNTPIVGIGEASNAIKQSSLSGTGSTKQNRETSQSAEVDVQVESPLGIRKALANSDFELR